MKKLMITIVTLLIACTTFAIKVTVKGAGGEKISYNDGKVNAHICPQKAQDHCATLEITGDDIKILSEGIAPGPGGNGGNGDVDLTTIVFELVHHTPIEENVWEEVILLEK